MRSKQMIAAVMAVLVLGTIVSFAEEPAINPVRVSTRQLNVYGTNPLQIHSTNVSVTAAQLNAAGGGSTATLTPTTVTASGKVSSYGYPAVVGHTNGSAQVYMTQSGDIAITEVGQTITNTFPVTYIVTPQVVYSFDAVVETNRLSTITKASNAWTISNITTTGQWIAHGRIK